MLLDAEGRGLNRVEMCGIAGLIPRYLGGDIDEPLLIIGSAWKYLYKNLHLELSGKSYWKHDGSSENFVTKMIPPPPPPLTFLDPSSCRKKKK